MRTPLVSILMTSYNREKYLGEAIESVLGSTYQNWELIIVDDQSKDRTVEIAKEYEKKDRRIKVYINEKNLGDYPNRNKAASYAKGKYLKYVDSDDLIYPYGLELLVNFMEQFPEAGYGLCSIPPFKDQVFPIFLTPEEAYRSYYFRNSGIFDRAPLSAIIKKETFDKVGGFSGKQHIGDFELWHVLSRYFGVVLMPQGMVWYREHPGQQMEANRTDYYVLYKYIFISLKFLEHSECPIKGVELKEIIKKRKNGKVKFLIYLIKKRKLKSISCLLKLEFGQKYSLLYFL